MRMPLFSYFVVMGLTITMALIYISDRIEPLGSPVPTSQIVGIAKSFKPYAITGPNFAAAYKPASARAAAEPQPTRRVDSIQQQQPVAGAEAHGVSRWKYIAQNPIAALMRIH